MTEKQLLLFDQNSEPIPPALILSNLTPEEKEELKKMQEAFEKFYNMDSNQMTNYNLWKTNFSKNWGDFNKFIQRLNFLENNKKHSIKNLKSIILENNNINKLKTIKTLWKYFWNKNQYSIYKTNGIRNPQEAFDKFKNKKSIQKNNKIFNIEKLFSELKITSFEEYQKLIKDSQIISALKSAQIIFKTKKRTEHCIHSF